MVGRNDYHKGDDMKEITKRANGSKRVRTVNDLPTRTQQHLKEKVNVNSIIAKYRKTGLIDHVRKNPGVYLELTELPDYQTAMETIVRAQSTFETIPANLRLRFNNDPKMLIDFLSDDKNYEEASKLGLVVPRPPKTPVELPKSSSEPK